MLRIGKMTVATLLLAGLTGSLAGQTPPAQPGGQGGGGGFDPAAIRERIMSTMKTSIDCTDDEWKVIEPKLVKVILLKMDAGSLGINHRFSTIIRTILDPNGLPSPVDEKINELQTMIAENETSTDAYRNKVAQIRKARERAKEELATAIKAVTDVLTVRQEAALVQLGVLE